MYDKELIDYLVKLHLEEGRTQKSLSKEYGISSETISRAVIKYRKEAASNKAKAEALKTMDENLQLRKENAELKKEIDFLKKAAAFFAKNHE